MSAAGTTPEEHSPTVSVSHGTRPPRATRKDLLREFLEKNPSPSCDQGPVVPELQAGALRSNHRSMQYWLLITPPAVGIPDTQTRGMLPV